MKSFFRVLFFVILVSLTAVSAFASIEAQTMIYESGKTYTLTEEQIDLRGLPVYAPAHMLESINLSKSDQQGLVYVGVFEDIFHPNELVAKYASDDLSTIMFENLVCLRNGRLIITGPSYTRGVEDTYGVFERISKSANFYQIASLSGMTFSSDGRYALFIDGYSAVVKMHKEYQLIILDVEAGEWYLGYTWPTKVFDGAEMVVGACFDETNEYIYIKGYGTAYSLPNSLLRYQIETGEMEPLASHKLMASYLNLFRTPNGSFVHELSPNNQQPAGLAVYRENQGEWSMIPHYYQGQAEAANILRLNVNSHTGQALILASVAASDPESMDSFAATPMINVLSLPVIKDGVENLQEFIRFDPEMNHAERVALDDYLALEAKNELPYSLRPMLINADLSPDGKYAFVLFSHIANNERYSARILNTETLEVSVVTFDEGTIGVNSAYDSITGRNYPIGVRFIANDLVVINTDDSVRLFRIH